MTALLDHTKINRSSIAAFASIADIDTFITDEPVSEDYFDLFQTYNVELIVAKITKGGIHLKFKGFDTNFGIENKVAVITGGANGIGYAIAQLFIEKGASVALFDLKEDVAAIAKELHQERAIGVLCNVTDNASMDDAIKQAHTHYGKIDILVNCAGIALLDDAENISDDYWQKPWILM